MIRLFGCGDVMPTTELPDGGYEGFDAVAELISKHDFKFCNLETTIHNNEGYPSLFPGGGWVMSNPGVLNDLKRYGFNVCSVANNHMMDYSHKGLERTLHYLSEAGLKYAGAGMNLSDASVPAYVDCSEGRVALIAATSSFHDSDAAGAQSVNMPGRPGVNPLRHTEIYELEPDLFESVLKIEQATGINAYRDMGIRMGYVLQNENIRLREINFRKGTRNSLISQPLEKDMKRIVVSIEEAKIQADCIVISIHSHQFHDNENQPDDFVREFCHHCIDAGADIIFGHGAHSLRGVEVYKGGIIFYSLADFIFRNGLTTKVPAEYYEKYNIPYEDYGTVGKARAVAKLDTKGLFVSRSAWESIAVSIDYENGIKGVRLYPIDLKFDLPLSRRGWPQYARDEEILKNVIRLSEPFGTQIEIQDSIGFVKI